MIKNSVKKVIKHSQGIEEPKIDSLIDRWSSAKNGIIKKFLNGSSFIVSENIYQFELGLSEKEQKYNAFIEYVDSLVSDVRYDRLISYLEVVTPAEFYSNILDRDYPLSTGKKIQKGTKIVKSFKYFITDEKLLHEIQSKASEIIQENKVEGYLVFSVHPLDFLSLSENTFNWRSCHSLDGEYRAGNLSYMCDSSTMICYLASKEDVHLPRFPEDVPWNSKKWRMLLHFNTDLDVAFAGRQYPFTSAGALNKVRDGLEVLYPEANWSHWHNDYIRSFEYNEYSDIDKAEFGNTNYAVINHGIYDIKKIIKNAKNSKHFNDVLDSTYYTQPYYIFIKHWFKHHNLQFNIGAEIKCLWCGEKTIDGYDSMMCPECECKYGTSDSEEYRTCDCCGRRFYGPQAQWVGDDCVCRECYEAQCFECEECGESYYNTEKNWHEESKSFLCKYCFDERNEE
jgi:hypothetical protein